MQISTTSALEQLAQSGHLFLELFQHGTLNVEVYKPVETDYQQPHDRDEVYIVISGRGEFINGNTRSTFEAGDFLFVPAGVEHRFVNFTDDFATWVLFYGPKGGEKSAEL